MGSISCVESHAMDHLDECLVEALTIAPRAQNTLLARVLGTSEQTIARRYRRLVANGLHISGTISLDTLGLAPWTIRLRVAPKTGGDIAQALARRDDTAWVYLASGGTEVIFNAHIPLTGRNDPDPLLARLPKASQVLGISAHMLLQSGQLPWQALTATGRLLTDDQLAALQPKPPPTATTDTVPALSDLDRAILAHLRRDGRIGASALSRILREPESSIRHRLARLNGSGSLLYVVDLPNSARNRPIEARAWLNIQPAHVADAMSQITQLPDISFAAITTGPTNLVAAVACQTTGHLSQFISQGLASLSGITTVETAPIHATYKRLGR